MDRDARIGVVGATGAVGTVTLELLRERGYDERARVRVGALGRERCSATCRSRRRRPKRSLRGDLDVCLFSVGTAASRELVPHAVRGGAVAVDKSSAYRLQDGVPLVVPEVNGDSAAEHDGIVANPNCCAIPLTIALKPLHDAAGLARVRVSTYQSMSGAGASRMEELRATPPAEAHLSHGLGLRRRGVRRGVEAARRDAQDPRAAGAADLRDAACACPCSSATRRRSGSRRSEPLSAEDARSLLAATRQACGSRTCRAPRDAVGIDEVLVGRVRRDTTVDNGLVLFVACDNLRKGAALNAIQIAELLLERRAVAA